MGMEAVGPYFFRAGKSLGALYIHSKRITHPWKIPHYGYTRRPRPHGWLGPLSRAFICSRARESRGFSFLSFAEPVPLCSFALMFAIPSRV